MAMLNNQMVFSFDSSPMSLCVSRCIRINVPYGLISCPTLSGYIPIVSPLMVNSLSFPILILVLPYSYYPNYPANYVDTIDNDTSIVQLLPSGYLT